MTTSKVSGLDSATTSYSYDAIGDRTQATTTTTGGNTSSLNMAYDQTGQLLEAGNGLGVNGASQVVNVPGDTFTVKSDGTIWGWGANASGQLGDATTTASTVPVEVQGISERV